MFFLFYHSLFFTFVFLSNMAKEEMPTLSSESYLHLHHGESLAVALVSPDLDSTNYHSWSKSMLTTLSAKNESQFFIGSTKRPKKENSFFNVWQRCNDMVVSWIVHSVSPNIRQSILWMEDTKEIWNDLKARFSREICWEYQIFKQMLANWSKATWV